MSESEPVTVDGAPQVDTTTVPGLDRESTLSMGSLDILRQSSTYKLTRTILIVVGTIIIATVMTVKAFQGNI